MLLSFNQQSLELFLILKITFVFCLIFLSLAYFLSNKNYFIDNEKLSPYECGFTPFENTQNKMEIHYYLIALLFVIFDIELVLLGPWAFNAFGYGLTGGFAVIVFLAILTVGFIFEIRIGVVHWLTTKKN